MARFDDETLAKLKTETDIVALIESYGTKLRPRGEASGEMIGLCPVHDDKNPSLVVNRKKERLELPRRVRQGRRCARVGDARGEGQLPPCGRTAQQRRHRQRRRSQVHDRTKTRITAGRCRRRARGVHARGQLLSRTLEGITGGARLPAFTRDRQSRSDRAVPDRLRRSHVGAAAAGETGPSGQGNPRAFEIPRHPSRQRT